MGTQDEGVSPLGNEGPLSYKYQRLREQLRQAIVSGEFTGKLPGERALAERFNVNAKTLSKALTDLAAEGLLDRSVGRGTYVKGAVGKSVDRLPWLILSDGAPQSLIDQLRQSHINVEVVTDINSARPSFLNQFSAIIDLNPTTPERLLRDLIVRNVPVVTVGKEISSYSTHAVMLDQQLAVSRLARLLLLQGHRKLRLLTSGDSSKDLLAALEGLVQRYAPDAQISAEPVNSLNSENLAGVTGILCDSVEAAATARDFLDKQHIAVPGQVSLLGTGLIAGDAPCSGFFVTVPQTVEAICHLLREADRRPVTLWLSGKFIDRGTCPAPGENQ